MALTVLTLSNPDGEHRIPCPLHASLTLGCGPDCDVTFEGVGILPRHCVLYRTGERTFQIIGVYAVSYTHLDVYKRQGFACGEE